MSQDSTEARIDDLESRIAFLDELQEQLSDIVARQDREILQLKNQLTDLAQRLSDLGDSMPGESSGTEHEVPPHY
jgi:SlyX protein